MTRAELIGALGAGGATLTIGLSIGVTSLIVEYPVLGGQAVRYGLAGFNVCLIGAMQEADPAAVGVIIGCVPIVLAVVGPLLAGRPVRPRVLLAAARSGARRGRRRENHRRPGGLAAGHAPRAGPRSRRHAPGSIMA